MNKRLQVPGSEVPGSEVPGSESSARVRLWHLTLTPLIFGGLLLPMSVLATDNEVKAAVAISIEQVQEAWAGQQVTLNLDLKTTGLSFSNSHFNLPEVNGAFLMQTDTTTIKLTEKTDNQDWQIVRYPLALYPQRAGQIVIPPIDVRFTTSAGFGKSGKNFEFETRALELEVKLPPGVAPGDMVITTSSFELDHNWQPAEGAAKTGDAITLTVNRRADDISAMLLPPLPVFRTDGLATYPKAPEVEDKTNRGDLRGERVDSITWVVEKPGQYAIPGIRFQWWDPVSSELKEQIIPGLDLDMPPTGADTTASASAETRQEGSKKLLLMLVAAGLLAIALWFGFKRNTPGQHKNTGKAAFATLAKACRSNQAGQALSAIYAWLESDSIETGRRPRPFTLGDFARIADDKQLATELERLQATIITTTGQWQGDKLLSSMQRFRREIHHQKLDRSKTYLTPLNP